MLSIQTPVAAKTALHQNHLARDFHGAAIIDANNNEIPMTEKMIDTVLEKLNSEWEQQYNIKCHYPYNLAP